MNPTPTAISREDAEKEIRSVTRTCRGPRVSDLAVVRKHIGRVLHPVRGAPTITMSKEREAALLSLPSVNDVIASLIEAGDDKLAQSIDSLRTPCGADFNDIVCKGPVDGDEYAYECPRCGVKGSYRAPLYAIGE